MTFTFRRNPDALFVILIQRQPHGADAGGPGRAGGQTGGRHAEVGALAVVGQAQVGELRLPERVVHVHRHRHLLLQYTDINQR